MNITVVGTGYVGLVTGACLAEFGNHVMCVDNNLDKIATLKRGETPIYEPGLDALLERNVKAGRLEFTADLATSVDRSLVVFIAVGTPQGNDGRADLSFVREVAKAVAEHLNSYKVVVTKSTVPAGTGRDTRAIVEVAREVGLTLRIVAATIEVNERRTSTVIAKIRHALGGSVKGKIVALLGLTFKPNTDDLRESPAIRVLEGLLDEGARI